MVILSYMLMLPIYLLPIFLRYGSIMMGFFSLYCPVLPLLFISRTLYRRATEVIFTMWEAYAVVSVIYKKHLVVSVRTDNLGSHVVKVFQWANIPWHWCSEWSPDLAHCTREYKGVTTLQMIYTRSQTHCHHDLCPTGISTVLGDTV